VFWQIFDEIVKALAASLIVKMIDDLVVSASLKNFVTIETV
jgi:hypothetical protein